MTNLKEYGQMHKRDIPGFSFYGVLVAHCTAGKGMYIATTEGSYLFDMVTDGDCVKFEQFSDGHCQYNMVYASIPLKEIDYPLPMNTEEA